MSSNELLLALRAPHSGWLAALVCALDEALQDAEFGESQRAMVRGLIDTGHVPRAVAVAASERLARFEQMLQDLHAAHAAPADVSHATARPKLTLCGGA